MDEKLKKFWSGGFLYNPKTKSVFLHHRDGNTIHAPNQWAFFGGLNEGEESEIECFKRELFEEIGLDVSLNDIIYLRDYLNTNLNTHRFIYYVISEINKKDLRLGEGAGFDWVLLDRLSDLDLTEKTRLDLVYFADNILKK
jgi:8-oxo-dGTP pyrophosphatase MutT (NUDIX family)